MLNTQTKETGAHWPTRNLPPPVQFIWSQTHDGEYPMIRAYVGCQEVTIVALSNASICVATQVYRIRISRHLPSTATWETVAKTAVDVGLEGRAKHVELYNDPAAFLKAVAA